MILAECIRNSTDRAIGKDQWFFREGRRFFGEIFVFRQICDDQGSIGGIYGFKNAKR